MFITQKPLSNSAVEQPATITDERCTHNYLSLLKYNTFFPIFNIIFSIKIVLVMTFTFI